MTVIIVLMFSLIADVHGFSGITSHFHHSTWPTPPPARS